MAKRYIDADKTVDLGYLADWYQNSIDDTIAPIWTDEHLMELLNDFIVIPNDTPTADVVEVVHGEWEKTEAYPHWVCCSVCHKKYVPNDEWIDGYDLPINYCPNCGAKMDGERKDEM